MCSHLQRASCSGHGSSKKEQETGLNGSWTLVPFLSESWRCDTDLVSCQRTTRGIERGGNERLSTQHRAECAALNLLKGRKKDERKGDSHVRLSVFFLKISIRIKCGEECNTSDMRHG